MSGKGTKKQSEDLAGELLGVTAAHYADAKQAEEILVLDVRENSTVTDFFVLCSATSLPHLRAVHRQIRDSLSVDHGLALHGSDGQPESLWLVLDYVDVIVHVFHADRRDFYALETLWSDAPRIDWASAKPAEPMESED